MMRGAERAAMARALARVFSRAHETKRAPLALGAVSEAGVFEGYASLFGVADLGRDVVERGAFAGSLRKRGAGRVKMLWQHDAAEPIGTWLSIEEDERGLKVKGRLNLAVGRAREILALMREGQVDGLSIGFRTVNATQDRKTGLRHLTKIDLWEISLVTFPMLPQARVTAVKRAAPPPHAGSDGRFDSCLAAFARTRWRRAAGRLEAKLLAAGPLERRYAPEQPRDDLGRWTSGGGAPGPAALAGAIDAAVNALTSAFGEPIDVADNYSWGDLIADFKTGSGRRCVYKFDFATIVVPGSDNFPCTAKVLSSAASHGRFLNDN